MSGGAGRRTLLVGAVTLWLGACAGPRYMMPTPNVYLEPGEDVYADLSPSLETTEVQLFYATDRAPERDDAGKLHYGYGRSSSVGFGTVTVGLGTDMTWAELVEASRTRDRSKPVVLEVRDVHEIFRGPPTPLPYKVVDGRVVEQEDFSAQRDAGNEGARRILASRLAITPRKEVFLYIHGYNNTFDDGAFAMAELWHFLGRIGVPMVYTWPAGYPGLFGYTYDRESSEFTVYHLRRVLKFLASMPEVEKIHLIAHSRGTDVLATALRELTIELRAAGRDPRKALKIYDLVLAAPDLDEQVAEQRILGDKLGLSVHRTTVYTSPADEAIGIAAALFASPAGRVGTLGVDELPELINRSVDYGNANFALVNFPGGAGDSADRYGHSYFRDAPSVSSDLVIMLRDDADAGSPSRPLVPAGRKRWRIPPGYPSALAER